MRGPDVGSKSKQTRRRYRNLLRNQACLDEFMSCASVDGSEPDPEQSTSSQDSHSSVNFDWDLQPSSDVEMKPVVSDIDMKSVGADSCSDSERAYETAVADGTPQIQASIRQESITPPPLTFDEPVRVREEFITPPPLRFNSDNPVGLNSIEAWEDEIHDGPTLKPDTQSWPVLRDQVKKDLKKKSNSLMQINQLLIICNFATL